MSAASKDRFKPVKSILVSQPEPSNGNSPYMALAEKYDLKIDFRQFIRIEPVPSKEFRKQKIDILKHTAIIFTSRNAIDHFFAICKDFKIEMPADMKYFCISDQTAHYLQKYIVIRKRKLFVGQKTAQDLFDYFKKHKSEKYLFPCSDIRKDVIPNYMEENGIDFTEAIIYHTLSDDLSDLTHVKYDILAFFSPSGLKSLKDNFPDFVQGDTRIATFGPTTSKAAIDYSLVLDIEAPLPNAPSMTGALELYIKKVNNL